jgi:AraC-like DNA-binding protein
MEPLSDILTLLSAESVLSAGLTAGGQWSIRFEANDSQKLGAMLMGEAWLHIDGEAPVRLRAGDCYLMNRAVPYVLATDLSLPSLAGQDVFCQAKNGIAHHGGLTDFILIAGKTTLDPAQAILLTDVLPSLIHVPGGTVEAEVLTWLVPQLLHEIRDRRPGHEVAVGHLFSLMFLQVLRVYMSRGAFGGWLAGLGDPKLAPALRQIHARPDHDWTVEALAREAGQSRSAFSARFKAVTGLSPLDYVQRWRMQRAARTLRHGTASLQTIATETGYDSASAFSTAFKRVMGQSPGQYRQSSR